MEVSIPLMQCCLNNPYTQLPKMFTISIFCPKTDDKLSTLYNAIIFLSSVKMFANFTLRLTNAKLHFLHHNNSCIRRMYYVITKALAQIKFEIANTGQKVKFTPYYTNV